MRLRLALLPPDEDTEAVVCICGHVMSEHPDGILCEAPGCPCLRFKDEDVPDSPDVDDMESEE